MKLLSALTIFCLTFSALATDVQILHTNDLHGFFENSVEKRDLGGYAAVKKLMDEETFKAGQKGMFNLRLDAGDFMEGSIFYMARSGLDTLNIMNKMNYDAVVIGNHDWLMGAPRLNDMIENNPPDFAFLGANFNVGDLLSGIREHLKPYHVIHVGDVKIGIIGLTTREIFYRWRVQDGEISKTASTAKRIIKELKQNYEVDFVIALTHLGHSADKVLVEKTTGIDLVVGGHSHKELHEPLWAIDRKGKRVPIVQAGSHGKKLGRLQLRLEKNKPLKILDYRLLPVDNAAQDEVVKEFVQDSRKELNTVYGGDWLKEPIARTEVPLKSDPFEQTVWSKVITDAIRESAKADIAMHFPSFSGVSLPRGVITREDCFNTYPRVFDFEDRYGWHIWNVKIWGAFVQLFIKNVVKTKFAVSVSGLKYDLVERGRTSDGRPKYKAINLRINGEKINPFKFYTLALPEGIIRGGLGITGLVSFVLRSISKTNLPIWFSIMDKVEEIAVIDQDYLNSHSDKESSRGDSLKDRDFIPANSVIEF